MRNAPLTYTRPSDGRATVGAEALIGLLSDAIVKPSCLRPPFANRPISEWLVSRARRRRENAAADAAAVPADRDAPRTRHLSRRAGRRDIGCRRNASWPSALKISRATVVSAYRELEARGLVRGYVGRGTFVVARRRMPRARRSRGAERFRHQRSRPPSPRPFAIWSARRRSEHDFAGGRRAGARLFPDRGVSRAMNDVLDHAGDVAWRHGPTEGLPGVPRRRWRSALAAIRSTSS